MPVVGFSELYAHATDQRYGLAVVNVHALSIATGIIECAAEQDAPVVLSLCGSQLKDGLLLSVEGLARQAQGPVGLLAKRIQSGEQAARDADGDASGRRDEPHGVQFRPENGYARDRTEHGDHRPWSCLRSVSQLSGRLRGVFRHL